MIVIVTGTIRFDRTTEAKLACDSQASLFIPAYRAPALVLQAIPDS
jgi:hypothetical protein